MTKLFMVYLGGRAGQCHIELHDVRFVVGERIEDTYPALIQQWFGHKKNLHLDSYHRVDTVPGYDGRHYQVSLSAEPSSSGLKLYFVNLGGYQPDQMAEQHAFGLFACRTPEEAKQIAKQQLLAGHQHRHKDNLHDVDDCLPLTLLDNWHIHLTETQKPIKPLQPDWFGYEVIG